MIYINRDKIDFPKKLLNLKSSYKEEITKRLESKNKYIQARFIYNSKFIESLGKEIKTGFNNKCCFCESKSQPMRIVHYRPTMGVSNSKDIITAGYFWLAYKWFNIYYACIECYRNKANQFPVLGERIIIPPSLDIYNNYEQLIDYTKKENPLLLDPCDASIWNEIHFKYNTSGEILPLTQKAEVTIEILQLNRESLIKQRSIKFNKIQEHLSTILFIEDDSYKIKDILSFLNHNQTFLGLSRQILAKWLVENDKIIENKYPLLYAKLIDFFKDDYPQFRDSLKITSKDFITNSNTEQINEQLNIRFPRFIEEIVIENFKSIDSLKISLPKNNSDSENIILLIGENGIGKSSVLQAISLALIGQEQLNKIYLGDLNKLIRKSAKIRKATVMIKFSTDKRPVILEITPNTITCNRAKLIVPVIGLGSIRRLPEIDEIVNLENNESRIMGLFRKDIVYPKIEEWLGDIDKVDSNQFNEAAKSIREILITPEEYIDKGRIINRRNGQISINIGNGPESLEEICDGYSSVIGYTLYILKVFYNYWKSAIDAHGVVIIDEIENHLHPTWKIKIVSLLRKVFPRVTFIISTHDPLCLRNALKGEVWVMNFNEKRNGVIAKPVDIPPGMPIENLLVGTWFKMSTTYDEETFNLLWKHQQLILENSVNMDEIIKNKEEIEKRLNYSPLSTTLIKDYTKTLDTILESTDTALDNKLLKEKINQKLTNKFLS